MCLSTMRKTCIGLLITDPCYCKLLFIVEITHLDCVKCNLTVHYDQEVTFI